MTFILETVIFIGIPKTAKIVIQFELIKKVNKNLPSIKVFFLQLHRNLKNLLQNYSVNFENRNI